MQGVETKHENNAQCYTDFYSLPADTLLRKQEKLKRQLFARDGVSYIEKRIAILGGSSTQIIRGQLELFLLASGVKPSFYESEYNKYYEDAVFPCPAASRFRSFLPDKA